jgi:hypothetical protein
MSVKSQLVSILASFCVWTKSLICKDAANRYSTVQSEVRRVSKFPASLPDDVSFCPDVRQTSIICPDDVFLPSGHLHRIEKLLCQLAPSGRFSSTSGGLSVLERFTDSFQVQERENQSTVRTMWYPFRTLISVRQESQFKMNRPNI